VASVLVTVAEASLTVGQTTQATATARAADGSTLAGRTVTWASSNNAVATVSSAGLVTSLAAGSTNITATSEGQTGSVALTVTPVPVASVTVTLASPSVVEGQTTQATALLRAANGSTLAERTTTWSTSNAAVATVTQTGLVTGVAAGNAVVTATSEGQSGTASITVAPPPVALVQFPSDSVDQPLRTTDTLTVTLKSAAGATLTGRTVTFSVAPAGLATINNAGMLRMLQPGTVTVTATSEGRSATMRVRGTTAQLARIVDSLRNAFGLPAMGSAIVSTEGLIAIGVAGTRRFGLNIPVTESDKWHLGSNTKALTGVLAGMAVEAGVLTWSRTVAQAFPDLAGTTRAEYTGVTLAELLSHTSGVVNTTAGVPLTTDLPAARLAWTQYTTSQAPQNARGTYYYSNNGFGMAGAMIERAWGSSYEQLMASKIFTPLALVDVGWGPTNTAGSNAQPVGHRRTGGTWVACDACDNRPGLSAAGTLHMPLRSWARIIQELLLADRGRSSMLSQTMARTLTTNAVPAGGGRAYGMGWTLAGTPSQRVVGHDGSNTTNHSRAMMYPDNGYAILITMNAAEIEGITSDALNAVQVRINSYWLNGR
jgi:CubicO group peptidase (beta-lactamase class C family)